MIELTSDEKQCLRMWFRQAIAIVEMEEAKRSLAAQGVGMGDDYKAPSKKAGHSSIFVRRSRRSRLNAIAKQLV